MIPGGDDQDVGGTIHRLEEQLDTAIGRTTALHRTGANEEAVLAETAVAVGAAKALEILTGETLEEQLARREDGATPPPSAPAGRRWLRRSKPARP